MVTHAASLEKPTIDMTKITYRQSLRSFALTAAALAFSNAAYAWGADGHRLISAAAEQQLTPAARAEVQLILSQEPGATLASISTWADEVRDSASAHWHYINMPAKADCNYQPAYCKDGKCVVGATNNMISVLKNARSASDRLVALKYLVHLVEDAHQPLHAYGELKGGNLYQVQAFGKGTNLHAVWDTAMIQHWPGGRSALASELGNTRVRLPAVGTPASWAEESCRIAESEGFFPTGRFIDESYLIRWQPLALTRMQTAAMRLAATLNSALGSREHARN